MSFDRSSLSAFPRPQTSFIGRTAEIAAVHDLLAQPHVRLLTLTGPGGAGKTRLALQAGLAAPGFGDGRWFVELAGLPDPGLILPQIAQSLSLDQRGGVSTLSQLEAALRGREILLVLDNFEHVLAGATMLSQLISVADGVKMLITSRSPLNLANEYVVPVGALATAPTPDLPENSEAVELFLHRCRAIRGGSNPEPAELEAIVAICSELSGLPLAIELAAARMRVMSPRALLARLSQPLRILSAGPQDAPERHRSMREAIDWSYQLLSDNQRALLRIMGVFAGSVPLDGLESVASKTGVSEPGETIELVGQLADASMIEPIERQTKPRFLLLATVREFVLEDLGSVGELDQARSGHAAWIEELTERLALEFDGPREHIAFRRAEAELGNIRAAIGWLLGNGKVGRAARIVINLWAFWSFGGQSREGRRLIDRVLDAAEHSPLAPEDEEQMLLVTGLVAWAQGETTGVIERYERALALARELGIKRWEADAFVWIAQAKWYEGQYEEMRRAAENALAILEARPSAVAVSHTLIGIADMRLGDLDAARRAMDIAQQHYVRLGFTRGSIWNLQLLADLALVQGDFHAAAGNHRQSLALTLESGNAWGMFESHSGLIAISLRLGWTNEAVELLAGAELLLATSAVRPREGAWLSDVDRAHLKAAVDPNDFQRIAQDTASRSLPDLAERASRIALAIESGSAPSAKPPAPRRRATAFAFDLSPREQEVLSLLADGKTDRQIAETLGVSHGTARAHVAHVLQKLDARNRAVAVRKALEHDLV